MVDNDRPASGRGGGRKRATGRTGPRDSRPSRDERPRAERPAREPREAKEPKETKETKDARESKEVKPLEARHEERDQEFDDREEQFDDEDGNQSDRPEAAGAPPSGARRDPKLANNPAAEYTILNYYDTASRTYYAYAAEMPELKAKADGREDAIVEVEILLEKAFKEMRARGEAIPEPIQNRVYPEKTEILLSQGLLRRLDLLSRLEKLPMDKLIAELLSSAMEKRSTGGGGGGGQQRPQQHSQNRGGGRHQGGGRDGNRHGGRHGGGGGRKNFHETMDNRENFLEYVRNLEKGGGAPPGRWKK